MTLKKSYFPGVRYYRVALSIHQKTEAGESTAPIEVGTVVAAVPQRGDPRIMLFAMHPGKKMEHYMGTKGREELFQQPMLLTTEEQIRQLLTERILEPHITG